MFLYIHNVCVFAITTIIPYALFSSICSLKMDCEKLVQEKTEMQRHYVMVRLIRFFKPILRMLEIAVSRQAIIASLHLPPYTVKNETEK